MKPPTCTASNNIVDQLQLYVKIDVIIIKKA